jgi:hypothetical protein
MKIKIVDPRTGKTITPRRMSGKARRSRHPVFTAKYMTAAR